MKFGPIAVEDAEGAVLAHATTAGGTRFRKAHRLSAEDVQVLRAAGIADVIAAVCDPGDLSEDDAAQRIVDTMRCEMINARPPGTGRVNLHARAAGVFKVDRALVDRVNAVDPAITLATLNDFAPVSEGQMVATVKIIPFAVSGDLIAKVERICREGEIFAVHPFRKLRVALLQTELPSVKASVLNKTRDITEDRVSRSGSAIVVEQRMPHTDEAVARAIHAVEADADMILLFGASAMSDFDDVLPAAIRQAGGEVHRAGMPVDPGNLLVIGAIHGKPIIGAPGCARSPKENGFDWVLDRTIAGLPVTSADIAGMGVGGLLMEIPTRPQPREARERRTLRPVDIILLGAGRGTRMGGPNKLLSHFNDEALVVRVAKRCVASKAGRVTVVTGHQADRLNDALYGLDIRKVHNADYASGLSASLKAGLSALPNSVKGVLVVLGDMPGVETTDLDRMIDAFLIHGSHSIIRAVHKGQAGNPVLLPQRLFAKVMKLEGDQGARLLIEADDHVIIDVEIGEGALLDVDTPDALASAGGTLAD